MANAQMQYFVTKASDGTYGYDIYINGNLTIHQSTILTQKGNKGFETIKQADLVAKLVIQKLKDGEMPPTLTEQELKTQHIIN